MDVLGRDTELARIGAWLHGSAESGPAGPGTAESGPAGPGTPAPGTAYSPAHGAAVPVCVLEGEPGIGKTTLLAEAVRRARLAGWNILSCRPAPSDAGLPHVGLTDLLRPLGDEAFEGLPPPQRRPLEVALLRAEAGDGDLDPRAVGTGLTALLGRLCNQCPLMLVVDDAQWLDAASARSVSFAIRRLDGRPVRLLLAVRVEGVAGKRSGTFPALEPWLDHQLVQRLPVGPLSVAAIHQLLRQALGAGFPRPLLVRIHRAAGGNPFYALEIAREILRLGSPPPGQPLPIPDNHRDIALLRLRRLPRVTRDALAMVAAAPHPSTAGLDLAVLIPAEQAGIVRVRPSGWVEFTHPLFGSALYSSLPEQTRRELHRGLAARAASVEERARHLALAADGPDATTADVLDQAADVAGARGAADVAVELKELAVRLTPAADRQAQVRRELELAHRRYFVGDATGARRELERSLRLLPAGEERAQVLLELGSVIWTQGEGDESLAMLSQALAEAQTPALRARIHSRISALAEDCDLSVEHGEAALALLDENSDPLLYSFALHNVAMFKLYAGKGADHQALERGMQLQRDAAAWEMSTVPAYWARNFDDFGAARQRFEGLLRAFRERGDEASSSGVLTHLAVIEAMTGHMDRARTLAADAFDLAEQTGQETYVTMALWAKAQVYMRAGALVQARAAAEEILRRLQALPDRTLEGMARAVLGMAALSAGGVAEADRQLSRADEIGQSMHAREPANDRFHADHAEAVIGLGDLDRAQALVERMEARARALPRPWILAVSARSRGLLNAARGDLDAAMADCQRAPAAHQTLDMPAELGRTLLAVGRLHRRRNERQRAQQALEDALAAFESGGALGWAAVAREELRRALGRRGSPEQLTPTEREIAEMAMTGLRNHEIAARLFLSQKTVEANLSRVYRKLGVRSRAELARRLANGARDEPGQS